MKKRFFEDFKQYLLNEHKDKLHKLIGYYETLLQEKEALRLILEDYEKYYMDIHYNEDETEGYTYGNFDIYFYKKPLSEDYGWKTGIGYHYKLTLAHDERYWGYCECTPEDEGYIEKYGCTGRQGCDWVAPQLQIDKIENIAYFSFEGEQRDMWKLKESWDDDLKSYYEKLKVDKLKSLDERIVVLNEERRKLLNT